MDLYKASINGKWCHSKSERSRNTEASSASGKPEGGILLGEMFQIQVQIQIQIKIHVAKQRRYYAWRDVSKLDMEFSHRSGLWMNNLERRGGGGLAEVPRLARLVLVKGVEERGHVDVVVVVEVAPPLLVRTEKVLKLLQNNYYHDY